MLSVWAVSTTILGPLPIWMLAPKQILETDKSWKVSQLRGCHSMVTIANSDGMSLNLRWFHARCWRIGCLWRTQWCGHEAGFRFAPARLAHSRVRGASFTPDLMNYIDDAIRFKLFGKPLWSSICRSTIFQGKPYHSAGIRGIAKALISWIP